MPNYFTLTRKSNLEAGPVKLQEIDEELCKHFNVPCDPDKWYLHWYDFVGFALACGKTFDQLIADTKEYIIKDPDYEDLKKHLALLEYLNEHYTSDAWASRIK